MKILLVSMNSIHFRRWSDQLRDNGHEVYWFDILDQGYAPSMSWMTQITGWKKGFLKKRGRTFLKNKLPKLFNALVHKYDTNVTTAFEKSIQEIQPDLVHSFALYTSCLPILVCMNKHAGINWLYSSWGSDLFYRKNKPDFEIEVPAVLQRVNYLITDCHRDAKIAVQMSFKGTNLGVYPGGGGFEKRPVSFNRDKYAIVVKGYENELGKAIPVLQALFELGELYPLKVSVFGASPALLDFIQDKDFKKSTITVHGDISHDDVIALMENATYYIGNSISDGMPNTLLEAIFSGCIPIQSNPGNATEEVIEQAVNGFLIQEVTNVESIKGVIVEALENADRIEQFYENNASIRYSYLRDRVKERVLKMYDSLSA
ncbi:glycosyltransferase [Nonlabens ulvanivorans]|uniref:glycosyltransferase n=1 Tax=Nonlabens ulvanivorans TaxID=906888 RepID=UPI0037C7C28E